MGDRTINLLKHKVTILCRRRLPEHLLHFSAEDFQSYNITPPVKDKPSPPVTQDIFNQQSPDPSANLTTTAAAVARRMATSLGDFGKLPAELRIQIYYLSLEGEIFDLKRYPVLPLSQTSRRIRSEVLPIFHTEGHFRHDETIRTACDHRALSLALRKRVSSTTMMDQNIPDWRPLPVLHNVEIFCRTSGPVVLVASLLIHQRKNAYQAAVFDGPLRCRGEPHLRILHESCDCCVGDMRDQGWAFIRKNTYRAQGLSLGEVYGVSRSMFEEMHEAVYGEYVKRGIM